MNRRKLALTGGQLSEYQYQYNNMKVLIQILVSVCALMLPVVASAQTLPDVTVQDAAGQEISVRSLLTGKPMIISYWSTTCKPCLQELNAINDALEDWREEADFDVMAVSIDDVRTLASAKARAAAYGWDFICVYDPNQDLKRAMNVNLTPQSFVVDADGIIVFSHSGYTPGSEELLFEQVLELTR